MAGAQITNITVSSEAQLESTITQYIAQGYTTMNRTPTSATMVKRKEFNILWAIVGFFLCIIPLLVYAVMYANETDKMVQIDLVLPDAAPPGQSRTYRMSGDGAWWWDGHQWQSTSQSAPADAQRSPDGTQWWDGTAWHPVPGTNPAPEEREPPKEKPEDVQDST